jgi:hypothetical protein
VITPANYSELGHLLITATAIGVVFPLLVILLLKRTSLKAAGDPVVNPTNRGHSK